MGVRVVVVSAVTLYREGIRRVLDEHPGLLPVAEAADAASAGALLSDTPADVVLLDVSDSRSMDEVRTLVASVPGVKVVAIAVGEREQEVVACAEAGVSGIVPREASVGELADCLQAAVRDELSCSARMAATLLRRVGYLARGAAPRNPIAGLTPRETHLLELIEQGMSNKEIARALEIELSTVKNHVHHILEKLSVKRRGEAAALMHRARLERTGAESWDAATEHGGDSVGNRRTDRAGRP